MSGENVFEVKEQELAAHGPTWMTVLRLLVLPTFISALALGATRVHYLLFHTLVEIFSIIVALTALAVATTSRNFTRNHFTVYMAVAIGWCASLDLIHTLVYRGMHLVQPEDANLPTQLWIAARFVQAAALLSSPLFLRRAVHIAYLHLGFALAIVGAGAWIFSGHFPAAYVEGQGLTAFKINTEYVIIAMLLGASGWLWRSKRLVSSWLYWNIQAALACMVLSEFAFTRYVSVYGGANEVGHVLKIYAYWFVYAALVRNTLREPFDMLSRTASTYDAVPEPAFVAGLDGRIHQANREAAHYAGLMPEALIGRAMHPLFHAPAVRVEDCPVCARIARGESLFTVEIDRGAEAGSVECTVAPLYPGERRYGLVQVVRDITERKRMAVERERLVHDLGERVQELRCLYAISDLIDQPDLDVHGLLAGVVKLLPTAFVSPQHIKAAAQTDWGDFGAAQAHSDNGIVHEIAVNGKVVGHLRVFYPDETGRFLAQEQELIETVAQRVGEAIERLQAAAQIQRLNYLYDMLSATNRAIIRCRSNQELLEHVFDALILHGDFPVLYIATSATGDMPLHLVHTHGIDIDLLDDFGAVLADPQSSFGQVFAEVRHGKVAWSALTGGTRHAKWHDYLGAQGITERAVLPMMLGGRLFGVVGVYAKGLGTFDQAQLNLLEEMASDLEFALNGIAQSERRRQAEARAELSELRFREVFEASPAPMLILSLTGNTVRAINRALEQWLGYTLEDVSAENRWFQLVYADPAMQQAMHAAWSNAIAEARASGMPVRSPELSLRCKDGSERIAIGTMTLIGDDDAVVAWTDLTEIRRSEVALRASEQHFRGMIEQTVMGIYVRRDWKLIYVNPRFCEMVGWSPEELLGREIWEFTTSDSDNVARIREAREKLGKGESSVHYVAAARCKNGEIRELGLHANSIDWDGEPATIVMAEDITERNRAEAQIAQYVKQLEASMRGTLQAVSNMIDQRDPYTAGHERRVSLIASAIGREMGWPEERCDRLEMVGLVHDIGKISVPAEILSKPGRLSALEMQLIRGHAQAGYDILKDVPFPFPVADIIHQHHERLDGSGYPLGLKGEQILPEARVLAVADVIEAIATHRPYRPARGLDVALDELERGRGTQYDPDAIDAFSRLLHDKGYTLPQ